MLPWVSGEKKCSCSVSAQWLSVALVQPVSHRPVHNLLMALPLVCGRSDVYDNWGGGGSLEGEWCDNVYDKAQLCFLLYRYQCA